MIDRLCRCGPDASRLPACGTAGRCGPAGRDRGPESELPMGDASKAAASAPRASPMSDPALIVAVQVAAVLVAAVLVVEARGAEANRCD